MTRREENEMMCEITDDLVRNNPARTYNEMVIFRLDTIATTLIDISKSLAIIADMTESEDNE